MSLDRRTFLESTAGVAMVGLLGGWTEKGEQEKRGAAAAGGRPIVIASGNGLNAAKLALERIRGGVDPLDAVVAGVNTVEDDPNDTSVGLGGLPNEDGVVELDASVMHGATHKAGAVASLQRIRNPSSVAKLVLRRTDHVLLVGEGALRFARAHGFKEEDLLTDESRKAWLQWKETHSDNDAWLSPETQKDPSKRGQIFDSRNFTYGTVNCLALTEAGDLAGCVSTSGLSWKIPGRVGDSPIIGAGMYVDNEIGAAASTGRGEVNLQNLTSFLIVELMRGGATPADACMAALKRALAHTEKRLLDENGRPKFQLKFCAVRKDGLFGSAAAWSGEKMAVADANEPRLVETPGLFAK
ncbi:MAG: N(4)-(beta-N-acetylglucosaminyl)-L-asparaginase [Phycisphaerae bacterium]